ncbi:MAG TPA: ABC transporter permease, partial [Pseudomonadales bacterium]|nr:ABC transporter permease [Pseudomonadales bacterium]
IAFILTAVVCLLFILSGFPLVLDTVSAWAPRTVVDAVASMSFLTRFNSVARGVIGLQDLLFFVALTVVWLVATTVVIELKQAD